MTEETTTAALLVSNCGFDSAQVKLAETVRVTLRAALEDFNRFFPPDESTRNNCLTTAAAFLAMEDNGDVGAACAGLIRAQAYANAIHTGGDGVSRLADAAVVAVVKVVPNLERDIAVERAGNNFLGGVFGRLVAEGVVGATIGKTPFRDNLADHLLPTDQTLEPLPSEAIAATGRLLRRSGFNLNLGDLAEVLGDTGRRAARAATIPLVRELLTQLNGSAPTDADVLDFLNREQTIWSTASHRVKGWFGYK